MKTRKTHIRRGFTLMETVIAIGVLALLLTAFMSVFGPATTGLRRAITVQEADRLAAALERELVTVRPQTSGGATETYTTGFDKAYKWIKESTDKGATVLLYQYRGNPNSMREDGTMEPFETVGGVAGKDYIVQPIVRKRDDPLFMEDIKALEGRIFFVKLTQLIFSGGSYIPGTPGEITDPTPDDSDVGSGGSDSDSYPEASISFAAQFFIVPNNDPEFIKPDGRFDPDRLIKPVFTRNLAVLR